ncbi:esterase-like activity of phytase family protein [Oceanibium sediminis]|uniref:esterase-like activity of phytase family protein n=1 Tax=Oceanibium sediminis TaxID=2026339 RepID=UPI00130039A8|nr:esterase-like activity of phytase family protein [Oceanibium sediminis]
MAATLALALGALAAPAQAGPDLVEDARIAWRAPGGIGSFSGLALSADGTRIITVSDKGSYVTATLERGEDGTLSAVRADAYGPLLDPRGAPVQRYDVDAEGLAVGPDGELFVSFEANHRVWAYTALDQPARALPVPAAFRALQNNSGLEALFTGPDGALYTMPERSGELARPYPVYRYDGAEWSTAFSLPRRPPHLMSGADLGPDGRLYVVERHWNGFLSFSTRIRRFNVTPGGLSGEETLLESRLGLYDNLEGIATWRDPQGRTRLLLISDDNESFLQATELVEFIVEEPTPPRPQVRPRALLQ